MSRNSKKSFIELKYFSPFDINRIPVDVLQSVYKNFFGMPYEGSRSIDGLMIIEHTLPDLLLIMYDLNGLKNDIRKELFKHKQ